MRPYMDERKTYLYVIFACFLMVAQAASTMMYGLLFNSVLFSSMASVIIFIAELLLFTFQSRKPSWKDKIPITMLVLHFRWWRSSHSSRHHVLHGPPCAANFYYLPVNYVPLFLACITTVPPFVLGAEILRKHRKKFGIIGYVLIAFAIVVIILFFSAGTFTRVPINDALFLGFYSTKNLVAGLNPYQINYTHSLLSNFSNGTVDWSH